MKTIKINGNLISLDKIKTAAFEITHYMHGSKSVLVVTLLDGTRISQEHGWDFDAWATLDKIKRETAI